MYIVYCIECIRTHRDGGVAEGRYLTWVNEYQLTGTLMDRMPNVAVSSASGRGGMLKSTQNQTLFSWQGTIKTVKCCVILYIYTVYI